MVNLHEPHDYDRCVIEQGHRCADGVVRDVLIMPVCLGGIEGNSTLDRAGQIRDRLGNMRLCLVWYGQVRFPHQPHINHIEHEFDGIMLHCTSALITDEQVARFARTT